MWQNCFKLNSVLDLIPGHTLDRPFYGFVVTVCRIRRIRNTLIPHIVSNQTYLLGSGLWSQDGFQISIAHLFPLQWFAGKRLFPMTWTQTCSFSIVKSCNYCFYLDKKIRSWSITHFFLLCIVSLSSCRQRSSCREGCIQPDHQLWSPASCSSWCAASSPGAQRRVCQEMWPPHRPASPWHRETHWVQDLPAGTVLLTVTVKRFWIV